MKVLELHYSVHLIRLFGETNTIFCDDRHGELLVFDGMYRGVHAHEGRGAEESLFVTVRLLRHSCMQTGYMGHRRGWNVAGARTWELLRPAAIRIIRDIVCLAIFLAFTFSLLKTR